MKVKGKDLKVGQQLVTHRDEHNLDLSTIKNMRPYEGIYNELYPEKYKDVQMASVTGLTIDLIIHPEQEYEIYE